MSTASTELSTADIGDRHRRYVAFSMLAVGILYATSAAEHLVDDGVSAVLNVAGIGLTLLAIGFLVPLILWKFRSLPSDEYHLYAGDDGFVADVLGRGKMASWVVTFLLLVFLDSFAHRLEWLPTKFFLEFAIAVMLSVHSGVFLFLNRAEESDFEDLSGA